MISFIQTQWQYDIQYPKRDGSLRTIKRGNWWINQNTPVGEDAELWERKPYGGKKLLNIHKMIEPIDEIQE